MTAEEKQLRELFRVAYRLCGKNQSELHRICGFPQSLASKMANLSLEAELRPTVLRRNQLAAAIRQLQPEHPILKGYGLDKPTDAQLVSEQAEAPTARAPLAAGNRAGEWLPDTTHNAPWYPSRELSRRKGLANEILVFRHEPRTYLVRAIESHEEAALPPGTPVVYQTHDRRPTPGRYQPVTDADGGQIGVAFLPLDPADGPMTRTYPLDKARTTHVIVAEVRTV